MAEPSRQIGLVITNHTFSQALKAYVHVRTERSVEFKSFLCGIAGVLGQYSLSFGLYIQKKG